ncbi:MAG: DUF1801 domain-containing protein [Pseudomonadota bacterium]
MSAHARFATIDSYIESVPWEAGEVLKEIRRMVKAKVPASVETISYQMPAFRLDKVFFYFAAFNKHIGVYPPVKGDQDLQMALAPYRGEKGNLKFPLSQPMPYDLIGRVAVALSREYLNNETQAD